MCHGSSASLWCWECQQHTQHPHFLVIESLVSPPHTQTNLFWWIRELNQINRKRVIQICFELIRFRKYLSVCTIKSYWVKLSTNINGDIAYLMVAYIPIIFNIFYKKQTRFVRATSWLCSLSWNNVLYHI